MAAKTPDYTKRVAYIKEVRTSGTPATTGPTTSYATYPLNTIEGDTQIASLNSNQITLEPGRYNIEATVQVGFAGISSSPGIKLKLRNITDSTDAVIGLTTFVGRGPDTGDGQGGLVKLKGIVEISSQKVFELQWRAQDNNILAYGPVTFGDSEIYAVAKITKLA